MELAVQADGVGNTLEEAAVELVEVHEGGFTDIVLTDTVLAADTVLAESTPGGQFWLQWRSIPESTPGGQFQDQRQEWCVLDLEHVVGLEPPGTGGCRNVHNGWC